LEQEINFNKQSAKTVKNIIYGYTTLWRDHFGAARFVVALFGVTHFVADPFWSRPFWREFHENNFFFKFFDL